MTDQTLALPVPPQLRRRSADGEDLLTAADADADALADRLHDGALQALVVARYATDAVVRGGDPALARDAVQEALVALRRAVWLLRPRGADDLPAALSELAGRCADARTPLDLDVDAPVAAQLSPVARSVAYRLVQAVLHDAPAGVAVRMTQEGGLCALVVSGGALADVRGWTARAAAVGGHLDSANAPVRLLLPLTLAPFDHDPEGDR